MSGALIADRCHGKITDPWSASVWPFQPRMQEVRLSWTGWREYIYAIFWCWFLDTCFRKQLCDISRTECSFSCFLGLFSKFNTCSSYLILVSWPSIFSWLSHLLHQFHPVALAPGARSVADNKVGVSPHRQATTRVLAASIVYYSCLSLFPRPRRGDAGFSCRNCGIWDDFRAANDEYSEYIIVIHCTPLWKRRFRCRKPANGNLRPTLFFGVQIAVFCISIIFWQGCDSFWSAGDTTCGGWNWSWSTRLHSWAFAWFWLQWVVCEWTCL